MGGDLLVATVLLVSRHCCYSVGGRRRSFDVCGCLSTRVVTSMMVMLLECTSSARDV